ncbi:PsbP-related protein [Chloroflexota bacterium]
MKRIICILAAVTLLIGLVGIIGCNCNIEIIRNQDEEEPELELEFHPLPPSTGIETELYTNSEYGFSIEYPKGWDLEEDYMGTVVIFAGDLLENRYMTNVNILIEEVPAEMTLEDYAKGSALTAKKKYENFQIIEQYRTTTIDGYDAIVTTYRATVTYGEKAFACKDASAWILRDEKAYSITYDILESYHSEYLDSFWEAVRTFKFQ